MAIWRVCAYALFQTHPNIPMISPLSPYKTPVKSPEVHQFICISIEKQFPRPPNAPPALHATSGSTSRQRQLGSQQIGDPMTSPNPEGDGKIWRISDVQSIKMGFCVQKWTMFGGSGIPNFDRDVDKCSKPSCSFRPRSSLDLCGTFAPELCDPKSIGAHQKSGQCSSKLVVWDKSRSGQSRGQLICVYIYIHIYIYVYIYTCI